MFLSAVVSEAVRRWHLPKRVSSSTAVSEELATRQSKHFLQIISVIIPMSSATTTTMSMEKVGIIVEITAVVHITAAVIVAIK